MCYSASTSISTFLFVLTISSILWIRNSPSDRAFSLIFLVIASMQFIEYILWTEQPHCTTANKIASASVPFVLILQPLLIALILWQTQAGWASPLFYILLLLGILCVFLTELVQLKTPTECVTPGPNGHLSWKISAFTKQYEIAYYIAMLSLLATAKRTPLAITLIGLYSVPWVYFKIKNPEEWSSLWCHAVNAGAVAALVI